LRANEVELLLWNSAETLITSLVRQIIGVDPNLAREERVFQKFAQQFESLTAHWAYVVSPEKNHQAVVCAVVE
jgi:hypothetical protein